MEQEPMPSEAQTEMEVAPEAIETDSNQTEESIDDVKARLADEAEKRQKAEELANNYKVRAEKAERAKNRVETKMESGLSSKDTIAIVNAKIHEDDVDDVLEYAEFKKIPIAEALKSSVIKATLKEKQELRDTATATNTGRTRQTSPQASGEVLLDKARKTGELPADEAALDALLTARYTPRKR